MPAGHVSWPASIGKIRIPVFEMGQDGFELLRREPGEGARRDEDDRPQPAHHRGTGHPRRFEELHRTADLQPMLNSMSVFLDTTDNLLIGSIGSDWFFSQHQSNGFWR